MLAPSRQRCHAAGVDEIQACQIDDDRQVAGRDRRERSRDTHSVCYIKLPAQRDDNVTVAFAGTQIHAEHGGAFLLQQQGGVLTQRRVYRYSVYTLRPISSGGDALLTAVPVRSATGPGRPPADLREPAGRSWCRPGGRKRVRDLARGTFGQLLRTPAADGADRKCRRRAWSFPCWDPARQTPLALVS